MTDKLTNKPITPSREMLELLKEWAAPDVTEIEKKRQAGKTNFMGVPLEQMYERVQKEEEQEEEEVPQLTAEEIEQIRQDAYNEGFEQGKQDGFEQGKVEGLEAGQKEGLELGHQEGHQQGLEQGQQEIDAKSAQWQNLLGQLYNPVEKVDTAAEQQLLNLAVMLAQSVIRAELKSNKDALLKILHDAVSSLPFNTEYAELHMNPADVVLLKEEFSDDVIAENKWIIKEEPSYQPGDLVVGTPNSLIDQTVKQRIKQSIDPFVESAALNEELNDGLSVSSDANVNDAVQSPLGAEQTEAEEPQADLAQSQDMAEPEKVSDLEETTERQVKGESE